MKIILLLSAVFLIPPAVFSQKNSCKFVGGKDENGKPTQFVAVPSKIGKFFLRKSGDNYFVSYSTKILFMLASDDHNRTQLAIDSVTFYFADRSITTLPARGAGTIQNSIKLKNTFDYVQLEVPLNSKMVAKMSTIKLTDIQVRGEKDAGMHDFLQEKNQDKLIEAFTCW